MPVAKKLKNAEINIGIIISKSISLSKKIYKTTIVKEKNPDTNDTGNMEDNNDNFSEVNNNHQ